MYATVLSQFEWQATHVSTSFPKKMH